MHTHRLTQFPSIAYMYDGLYDVVTVVVDEIEGSGFIYY